MAITAGLYAWQVHGWIWGLLVALFIFVAVPMVTAPMFWRTVERGTDPLVAARRGTWLRWGIWGAVLLIIAISGARYVSP